MDNKMVSNIKNIMVNTSDTLTDYLDVKNPILENEFIEAFGDSVKVVNFLKCGHDLIGKRKLKYFLNGLTYDNNPTEEQLLKLHKYINNETKAEFIADMFSKVLMSNSKLACMVMGIMINDLTSNDKDITHSKLICANALTNFFDYDIKNYLRIIDFLDNLAKTDNIAYHRYGFYESSFKKVMKDDSVFMTLNKAVSNQLIVSESDIDTDFYEGDLESSSVEYNNFFLITGAGKILNEYIRKLNLD